MKRVVLLGSTGSIGTQTLDVIAQFPDELRVVGLAAGSNADMLQKQAKQYGVQNIALYEGDPNGSIPIGMDAIVRLATMDEADIVVVSVAGVIGLLPTVEAIKAGKNIALASKEVLVAAGEIVMPLVRKHDVIMTPIDSEHSAIFQCMQGYTSDQIKTLILTASGGPFRGKTRADLEGVTVDQALNHPTWKMGGKITIDSATLMNKGLETIEAKWLFDVDIDNVKVVVHPQSIIHSIVEFKDGSALAQMGWPDMRLPIAYSLLYPERKENNLKPWNPVASPNLTFEEPDVQTFRCLELARESARIGGTMPCVMNAANEEAANAFLRNEIGFLQIAEIVEKAMQNHTSGSPNLDNLLETDVQTRSFVRNVMNTASANAAH